MSWRSGGGVPSVRGRMAFALLLSFAGCAVHSGLSLRRSDGVFESFELEEAGYLILDGGLQVRASGLSRAGAGRDTDSRLRLCGIQVDRLRPEIQMRVSLRRPFDSSCVDDVYGFVLLNGRERTTLAGAALLPDQDAQAMVIALDVEVKPQAALNLECSCSRTRSPANSGDSGVP